MNGPRKFTWNAIKLSILSKARSLSWYFWQLNNKPGNLKWTRQWNEMNWIAITKTKANTLSSIHITRRMCVCSNSFFAPCKIREKGRKLIYANKLIVRKIQYNRKTIWQTADRTHVRTHIFVYQYIIWCLLQSIYKLSTLRPNRNDAAMVLCLWTSISI